MPEGDFHAGGLREPKRRVVSDRFPLVDSTINGQSWYE